MAREEQRRGAGKKTIAKRVEKATAFRDKLAALEDQKTRIEAVRMARALALAGLPKRRTDERDIVRTMRLGKDYWLRVMHSARRGNLLPYGQDRFVLAGVQHLALEQDSPVVFFHKVSQLLDMFGIDANGRSLRVLRERFQRISALSIHLTIAETEAELDEENAIEQIFVIRKHVLPSRAELEAERAGQINLPRIFDDPDLNDSPYGAALSDDFWNVLKESSKQLIVPLDLLKMFIDRPTGWDYACFLVARCGSAKSSSVVPHEALMALFKDSPGEPDRNVVTRLKRYHDEVRLATGGRLNAEFFEDKPGRSKGGRPPKRWSLKVAPSSSLISKKILPLSKP